MAARKKPEEPQVEAKSRRKPATVKASTAVDVGSVDAQTVAAMMAQMQSLLAEVQELRQVVASGAVAGSVGGEAKLPDRFAKAIEDAESGIDDGEVDSSIEGDEAEALLAGFDAALSSVGGESLGDEVHENVDNLVEATTAHLNDGVEFEPICADELAELMASAEAEAGVMVGEEEEFDKAEMEALLAAAGSHVSEEVDSILSADELREALSEGLECEVQDWNLDRDGGEGVVGLVANDGDGEDTIEVNSLVAANDSTDLLIDGAPLTEAVELVQQTDPVIERVAEDDGGVLSDDEIAMMLAGAAEQGETETVKSENTEEDDGGVLGDDEIAALLAGATGATVSQEPSEANSPDSDDGVLSDDEIAALLSQADTGTNAGLTAPEVQAEVPEDDGPMLTEEELAKLVRGEIERQDQELESLTAGVSEESQEVFNESPSGDGDGILSADEIAALLSQPDPSTDPMPETSTAMDEDELAALLAAAQDIAPASTFQTYSEPVEEPLSVQEPDGLAVEAQSQVGQRTPIDTTGDPDPGAVKLVPAHLAIRALALPMKFADGKLVCHVAEPVDQKAIDSLSKAIGFGIVLVPQPITEVVHGLRAVYSEVRDEHARLTLLTENEVKPTFGDKVVSILRRIA